MIMEINLSHYGKIISTDDTSNNILDEIVAYLDGDEPISINASGVVISTKSARLIFGYLYINIENGTKNININITTTIISMFLIVHNMKITDVNENNPQIIEFIKKGLISSFSVNGLSTRINLGNVNTARLLSEALILSSGSNMMSSLPF